MCYSFISSTQTNLFSWKRLEYFSRKKLHFETIYLILIFCSKKQQTIDLILVFRSAFQGRRDGVADQGERQHDHGRPPRPDASNGSFLKRK